MASEMLKKALIASAHEEYLNIENICESEIWEPSEQFAAQMQNIFDKTKNLRFVRIKKVLLVAVVIALISVMTVFSFAGVRENVINFFKEYYYTHFDLEYGINDAGDIGHGDGINTVYTFSSVPKGFEQVSITADVHSVVTVWENANEDAIILSQGDGMTKRSIDVERLQKTEILSAGVIYELYSQEDYILLLWNTAKYTFSIDYYGKMNGDEIIKLAESLTEDK